MEDNLLVELKKHTDNKKIIVFDDDPTGSQTVYDLPIFIKIDYNIVKKTFEDEKTKGFYILTNTRSMSKEKTEEINSKLAQLIDDVSKETGIDYEIICRGDSTLRGHFLLELDVIKKNISKKIDGYILMPFFEEGGRITIDDIHYVKEDDKLIPVGETQFAQDHTFGFKSSNLLDYVEEKSEGMISRNRVISISIEELRGKSPTVLKKLLELDGKVCVVNAEKHTDVQLFVIQLIRAENEGKNFLFRTAASFVKARLGLADKELLNGRDLNILNNRGGLIIAGSYIKKTTQQINHLINETGIENIEVDVSRILLKSDSQGTITNISKKIDSNILKGIDTLVYTSRKLILGNGKHTSLDVGNKISEYLIEIVDNLTEAPAFIVAKGGNTSNDIASRGLNIKKANVCGQIARGVPVWKCEPGSKFDDLIYIVFPGNVGGIEEVTRVYKNLRR